jgi:hypothetical protein
MESLKPIEQIKENIISFARLDCTQVALDLQTEIHHLLQGNWVDHVNQKDYQGGWDVLPLRCQRQHVDAHPILQGFAIATGDEWENLSVLAHCPLLSAVIAYLQCPVKAARLMRLKAGAEIHPHRDAGLGIEYGEARLHMPIQTSDAVEFYVNQKRIPMEAGELWYINADQVHEVYNRGDEDRINLVIDCVANDWLRKKVYEGNCV